MGLSGDLGISGESGSSTADSQYLHVEFNNNQDIALKGNFSRNCLNDLYFSKINMDALQMGMRNMVASATKGETIIGKQSDTELLIIMRGIYNQYGLNQPDNIVEQVKALNKMVLDYSVKQILREIEQYKIYVRDASQMNIPMDRSQNVSNKGSKILYRDTLF